MIDVVIIGGGINGLVAAATLARHKLAVVVLDQCDRVGGAAITNTSTRGFSAPRLSHSLGPLAPEVVRALHRRNSALARATLKFLLPDPVLTTLGHNGECVTFHRDDILTAASINRVSAHDAGKWQSFVQTMQRLSGVMANINRHAPPSIDAPSYRELIDLFGTGRRARALGRRDLGRLARYAPMAVADLVAEWFEHDLVQAAIAVRGVFGHLVGPWSAGTGAMLMNRMAEDPMPVGGGVTMVGGPGALAQALAELAEASGALIRTQARVARVLTHEGVATGVVLESGEEIAAHAVVGAIDPRHLCLNLVDPADFAPSFLQRMRQVRGRGVTAKINLSLSAAPVFAALHGDDLPLKGRLLIAPDIDYIERAFDAAKYGHHSPHPWLEIAVPTMNDSTLAPEGQHVMSLYVHYAPRTLREGTWSGTREALYRSVMSTLAPHAPGLEALIVEREVITPEDLETHWGFVGGHIFHGEQTLDQWWVSRPVQGAAQYQSPIQRLYFASAGTHPGGGLTGQSGLNAARAIVRTLKRR
ncbi:MAG: NAD(P)/FAD-dependent oxidoreductase [Acidobacteria bacterium]|nr:NAD(P)/FAD-dependent oxidoreductase [Acidobacteriota bacterium]